jgi:hypothetical protein
MAFVLKDRVRETTTTTGTGTVTLAGPVVGFQSFGIIGNNNTTFYTIASTSDWEVGVGTYTASGTTLSRDIVLDSSNGGSLVSFGAGDKDVFVTFPASAASSIQVSVSDAVTAAGTTQAGATLLVSAINNVTVVASGADGVRMPLAIPGSRIVIRNSDSADTLKIYPASGAKINALSTDQAYTLLAGSTIELFAISTTQWYSFGNTGWGGV